MAKREHAVTAITFGGASAAGRVTLTRAGGNLVYVITEISNISLQTEVHANVGLPGACTDLPVLATHCRDDDDPEGLATACPTGRYGQVIDSSGIKVCLLCPSGSNTCLPCQAGSYNEGTGQGICLECPPDSYAWIPGSTVCMRCIGGVPVTCPSGNCGTTAASPGSHILQLGTLTDGSTGTCALSGSYAIGAYTNCPTWTTPGTYPASLAFALSVAGDCSIDLLPIGDPAATCTEPLAATFPDNQMRAYYATTTKIISTLPIDVASSSYMFTIEKTGSAVSMYFWAATTDAAVVPPSNICKSTATVAGGKVIDEPTVAITACPAGSYLVTNQYCHACPEGTYSGEGALGLAECQPCPPGQYNPSPGLGDQETVDTPGQNCLLCPEGSVALSGSQTAATTTDGTMAAGATFCDACPAGFWQDRRNNALACKSCARWPDAPATPLSGPTLDTGMGKFTYRSGDASPENNQCLRIPSGYRLRTPDDYSEIELCEIGTVSFWNTAGKTRWPHTTIGDEARCMSCSGLETETGDVNLYPHTYAPRAGMMSCIACPAGTVPKDITVSGAPRTTSCQECPDGKYRDAYTPTATCTDCGQGKEVGPSAKQDCTLCRPGTFKSTIAVVNFCTPCAKHQYRPTAGALSCLLCPKGTQTQDVGNIECTPCAVGYYNGVPGTECDPSPTGTYVNTTGAFYPVPCPKGTWNNEQAQDNCNSCPPGKYSNTLGSKDCKTCAGGTFSTGQASACTDCRAGYAAAAGSSSCTPCKPGTYAPDPKSLTCKPCPRGYQCPTSAMRRVSGCPKGTYSNKEGNKLCTPCPVNTYSTGGSTSSPVFSCTKCDVGKNTRGLTGQSICQVIRPQVKRLSYFKLDLVNSTSLNDVMGRCLTSVQVNVYSDCKVSLTPLNSEGNWVPGIWSGDATNTYQHYVECPRTEGPKLTPVGGASAVAVAIKAAIRAAIEGHVYGYSGATPLYTLTLSSVAYAPGRITITSSTGNQLVYAVTESTILSLEVDSNISPPTACSQLDKVWTCLDNTIPEGIANPCPPGRYGIFVSTEIKVCGLCPAGSYSDEGNGCTSCEAGRVSTMGQSGCAAMCGPGTFSPGGSSTCLPCPAGTYSEDVANQICTGCPPDSYAWIPGSTVCMRCIGGVPVTCTENSCTSTDSSPGSHILQVGQMSVCGLSGSYEVKAHTKCTSWAQAAPTVRVQLALEVAEDCSIDIKPIADPACADTADATGHPYSNIVMRAYYATPTSIRSLLPSASATSKGPMVAIDQAGGAGVLLSYFAASQDPADYNAAQITGAVRCSPLPGNTAVIGGQVVGNPSTAITQCPARSYIVPDEYCYACPPGSYCPGGSTAGSGPKGPCAAGQYNPYLGQTACLACPLPSNWTSYGGAIQCNIPALDTDCFLAKYSNVGMEYDPVSQRCQPCQPGTRRNDVTKKCELCPAGEYSGSGAATCTKCPVGQYSPTDGMPDQQAITGISGRRCLLCPRGSLALSDSQSADSVVAGQITTGATFCDACPAGFVQDDANPSKPCVPCAALDPYTYRTGDATPENNKCVQIPSGYVLGASVVPNTRIALCPAGTVSYWDAAGDRVPPDQYTCLGCAELYPNWEFAHTYAPAEGMTACIPCPAGTVPVTTGDPGSSATASCTPCPDGYFRDAYTKSDVCMKCGEGKESGPHYGQDCTACRPGHYMTSGMASDDFKFCLPCPRNTYQASMGSTFCTFCPRGYGTQDTGNEECAPCPIGYYSLAGGDCRPAPPGTFINTTAAYLYTACPAGTWNNEAGQDNCNSCAAGKYSNTIGSTECKTCPAGAYSKAQSSRCLDCRAGYSAPPGSDKCNPCKPGYYTPNIKSPSCLLCAKGFQCPTPAMKKPLPCPRGTFSNKEGNRVCTPCPINTISAGGGVASAMQPVLACTKCPIGTSTRGLPGQSKCQVLRPQVRRLMEDAP
ncbi:multiple epidermal growth factor-like domains 6 [Micractinium conductrix]|uniref:Multiple epidermal growth factor-like domains 6 n=1 Tax=Micractinium conductrix TaxID=554055 RepID=A0A2P6VLZ5_9CHLO|nr:multiple epidermal growth factor-like domains 6 [Micractinium conductrix]|eukprot:PSC75114.1 multiple epidermal growth factor-like domains 6 [Micractinium conductrix]